MEWREGRKCRGFERSSYVCVCVCALCDYVMIGSSGGTTSASETGAEWYAFIASSIPRFGS